MLSTVYAPKKPTTELKCSSQLSFFSEEAWNSTNLPDIVEYGSATVLVFAGDEVKF